jgi:hypothetical protein
MVAPNWRTDPRFGDSRATLEIARDFIRCYTSARRGLTTLGILRSERTLQGDYAEWLIARLLNLELATSGVHPIYDATDETGKTYQIKARVVRHLKQSTSFDFRDLTKEFDYLVCVFLEEESLDLLGVLRVPYNVVREHERVGGNRFAWNRQAQQDDRIERVIWQQTAGQN